MVTYVAWRADQVLYSSHTLDIYGDDIGSCIIAQDHALAIGGEARAKEYSRPLSTYNALLLVL